MGTELNKLLFDRELLRQELINEYSEEIVVEMNRITELIIVILDTTDDNFLL